MWNVEGSKIVYAHSGYEFFPGQLSDDLEKLKNGENVEEWDGNGIYTGFSFETWEDIEYDLEDVYKECTEACELVADNDGIYPKDLYFE